MADHAIPPVRSSYDECIGLVICGHVGEEPAWDAIVIQDRWPLTISPEPADALLFAVCGTFLPQRVIALAWSGAGPDFMPLVKERGYGPTGGRAYVCRDYACQAPVESVEDLCVQLGA